MSVPCKYPAAQGLFFFDHTPSHMKCPKDALDADRMNVKDSGKQPFMRDTVWNGHVHKMVTSEGLQKEMKSVLQERRVDTSRINAEKPRELLHQYEVWIQINAQVTHIIKFTGYRPHGHAALRTLPAENVL